MSVSQIAIVVWVGLAVIVFAYVGGVVPMSDTVTITLERGVAERTLSRCPSTDDMDLLTVDQRTLRHTLISALAEHPEQTGRAVSGSVEQLEEALGKLRTINGHIGIEPTNSTLIAIREVIEDDA